MLGRLKRFLSPPTSPAEGAEAFEPYIKPLDVEGIDARFFFGTSQARLWYDPLKPYAKLEYDWVVANVPLAGQNVVDGGAHHGQYSVVFALAGAELLAVDPYRMNCALTEVNLALNGAHARIERCAISDQAGQVHFAEQSNGSIIPDGGIVVSAETLQSLMPDANVVKLDVEGHEYQILPASVDQMSEVHTWIIEIHPRNRPHPDELIRPMLDRGFSVEYVDRDANRVVPYQIGTEWSIHSTVFCRKS